jgi:hypothetical protein
VWPKKIDPEEQCCRIQTPKKEPSGSRHMGGSAVVWHCGRAAALLGCVVRGDGMESSGHWEEGTSGSLTGKHSFRLLKNSRFWAGSRPGPL